MPYVASLSETVTMQVMVAQEALSHLLTSKDDKVREVWYNAAVKALITMDMCAEKRIDKNHRQALQRQQRELLANVFTVVGPRVEDDPRAS